MTDAALSRAEGPRRQTLLGLLLALSLPLLMVVMELTVYAFEPRVLSLRNGRNAGLAGISNRVTNTASGRGMSNRSASAAAC